MVAKHRQRRGKKATAKAAAAKARQDKEAREAAQHRIQRSTQSFLAHAKPAASSRNRPDEEAVEAIQQSLRRFMAGGEEEASPRAPTSPMEKESESQGVTPVWILAPLLGAASHGAEAK